MNRRRVIVVGVAAVALYLAGAALSGALSPGARRPLLDGFAPPPPYRWESPPPSLAASNEPPRSADDMLKLKATGSLGSYIPTSDAQVVLILGARAVPAHPGDRSIEVTIRPLEPSGFGKPPAGEQIVGNVYEVRAVYRPSGVPAMPRKALTLLMQYPAEASPAFSVPPPHSILLSRDKGSWSATHTLDSPANRQATAPSVTQLGYFAVGVPSKGGGGSILPVIIGVLLAAAAVMVVLAFVTGSVGPLRKAREPDDER